MYDYKLCAKTLKVSLNYFWILLFVIGFGIFFIGMPKFYDDYMFMVRLRPWFLEQGVEYPESGGNIFAAGFPLNALVDTWKDSFSTDNIRIANLLIPIFLMFPKWFGSGLMTIIWGITVVLVFLAGKVDIRKSILVPVGLALMMFCLPWRDHFGAMDYQFNYILTSLIFLLLLLYAGVFEDQRQSNPREFRNIICNLVVSFAFGILAGLMHEGFAIPVAVALIALMILIRNCRTCRIASIVAGLLLGAALLLSVPGMRTRAGTVDGGGIVETLCYLGPDGWAGALFYLVLAMSLFKTKSVKKALCPQSIFAIVNGLVTLAMAAFAGRSGRIFFWMNLVYITATISLLHSAFTLSGRKIKPFVQIGSVLLLISVYINLGFADCYALEYRNLQKRVLADYIQAPDKQFFGYCRGFKDQSPLAGYMMDVKFHSAGMFNVRWFYNFGEARTPDDEVIFPEAFRYLTSASGRVFPGDGKVRETNGYFFAKAADISQEYSSSTPLSIGADFGKGYVHVLAEAHRFRSQADGEEYVWIIPLTDWYVTHFKKIKQMRLYF